MQDDLRLAPVVAYGASDADDLAFEQMHVWEVGALCGGDVAGECLVGISATEVQKGISPTGCMYLVNNSLHRDRLTNMARRFLRADGLCKCRSRRNGQQQ